MNDKVALRLVLERLIQIENRGGAAARGEAEGVLDTNFLGITRALGVEQNRKEYLDQLAEADKPEADNRLRWLDIADPESAPDLVEPGSKGPRPNSSINSLSGTAVVRAVVTTRTRQKPKVIMGRFRNLFVLVRRGDEWKLFAWQVTPLNG